jgi:hypothetical protein
MEKVLLLHYKDESVNVVEGNNSFLTREPYDTDE